MERRCSVSPRMSEKVEGKSSLDENGGKLRKQLNFPEK